METTILTVLTKNIKSLICMYSEKIFWSICQNDFLLSAPDIPTDLEVVRLQEYIHEGTESSEDTSSFHISGEDTLDTLDAPYSQQSRSRCDLDVLIKWKPPAHVSPNNPISAFILSYQKFPLFHLSHLEEPHSESVTLAPVSISLNLLL